MTFKLFLLPAIAMCVQACADKQASPVTKPSAAIDSNAYNNTKGFWGDGQIVDQWDCPDSKLFSAIDIKSWDKTPVANNRLPTYAETKNGTAIFHYGEKESADIRPYDMALPRLAYHYSPLANGSLAYHPLAYRKDMVVVIQIVQTAQDTIVGYRYLSGGCGGGKFSEFYFLKDEEIKKVMEQQQN